MLAGSAIKEKTMKTFVIALLCLLCSGFAKKKFVKSKVPVTEKPHIVFILADDLGWNEVLIFHFYVEHRDRILNLCESGQSKLAQICVSNIFRLSDYILQCDCYYCKGVLAQSRISHAPDG